VRMGIYVSRSAMVLREKRLFIIGSPRHRLSRSQRSPAHPGLVSAARAARGDPIFLISIRLQTTVACEARIWVSESKLSR
jgi:hypothetical protein